MTINIVSATPEILEKMKGQIFIPHEGEGVVYIKLVAITPETMCNGDPQKDIEDAPGVLLCGQMNEIKNQINEWFDQTMEAYGS